MKASVWNAPEPTTVSSAIWFHCATVFPGGSAAASRVVPAETATANAVTAIATTRRTRARTRMLITVDLMIPPSAADESASWSLLLLRSGRTASATPRARSVVASIAAAPHRRPPSQQQQTQHDYPIEA